MRIDKYFSYIIGLAQTDGSLQKRSRGRGCFSIRLNERDSDIIEKISKYIKCNYTISHFEQASNFLDYKAKMVSIRICDKNFRGFINDCGVPYGKKSFVIKPPLHLEGLSIDDYLRGIFDGDGSIGLSGEGYPFINLTTASVFVKDFVNQYISDITGRPLLGMNRRPRGSTYDLTVTKDDAVVVVSKLYYNGCMGIKRKIDKANIIKRWRRPIGMRKKHYHRDWTTEEDRYIATHSVKESQKALNRTKSSVDMRKARLKYGKDYGRLGDRKDAREKHTTGL